MMRAQGTQTVEASSATKIFYISAGQKYLAQNTYNWAIR